MSRARSGSNLLISALRSHPQIHVEGEMLRRLSGATVEHVLNRIYGRSRPRSIGAVGFKMFYYHPLDDDPDAAWRRIERIDDLHLVHLTRQNRLRTVTSRKIAGQTRRWVDLGETVGTPPVQVTFTPRELVKEFERAVALERAFEERFAGRPMHRLAYEDLAADVDGQVRGITRFLGLRDAHVHARTGRQNPQPLSRLIANYDELARALRDTPWACYFDG